MEELEHQRWYKNSQYDMEEVEHQRWYKKYDMEEVISADIKTVWHGGGRASALI